MREIVLDTETTGLDSNNGDRLVEIGVIELENHVQTGNYFHYYLNPEKDSDLQALKIHGLYSEFLKDKPKFIDIADQFMNFVSDSKIIIHNAPFDLGFLNHELRLVKRDEIKKEQIIDSLEVAREKYPGVSNSLDALCKRFNIDLSRRKKHNALLDCELLREVYINLLDMKEPKLVFSNEQNEQGGKNIKNKSFYYCKKVIKPSSEELSKHKNFLKKDLKKNFY